MNRRDLIKSIGMLALAPGAAKAFGSRGQEKKTGSIITMVKPPMLKKGDTIGVIAPGTAVSDPGDLAKAKEVLGYFGLNMKIAGHVAKGTGYKTRSIQERIDDFHEMFANPNIKGVFAIRGGYGSGQLLDKLDYNLVRNMPKVFIGYSDITAMHLAINKMSGLVTFHGPVLLSTFTPFTTKYYEKCLFSKEPLGSLTNPDNTAGFRKLYPLRTIKTGTATGELIGGNLSMIMSLMGTEYEINTVGKIVFLEDVGEQPYKIDRMLTQLRLAGKFDKAAGVVFGVCSECVAGESQSTWDKALNEVLDEQLGSLKIPVITGLMFGHTPDQLTLPIGVKAELDAEKGTLNILESGVS